jgi:hypothetical protein
MGDPTEVALLIGAMKADITKEHLQAQGASSVAVTAASL